MARSDLEGFWILVDADVLNPVGVHARGRVARDRGSPSTDELALLLAPLVSHSKSLGLALTLHDPSLDPDRWSAGRLVELLGAALMGG